MKRIVVIGGGISGLAAAHRILERNQELGTRAEVVILESSATVGGIIQTQERDDFLLERGPDSFISEKPQALNLAKRLGLENHLIQTNPEHRRSFIVRKGRLVPVPEGFQLLAPGRLLPFLKSDIFSWPGKARIALDLLLPRRRANGETDESLARFVRRRLGQEALERMAQPMVGGIYTADPETLSLRATMPRFLEMERQHRSLILAMRRSGPSHSVDQKIDDTANAGTSGARYSLFLSFDRGMQLLTDTLSRRISELANAQSLGNPVVLNSQVQSLELSDQSETKRWRIGTSSSEPLTADAVCLALPAFASARLLRNVDLQLATEVEGIPYASSATINLAYRREDISHRLDGFGFVVPFIEGRSVIACTFSSVKFARRAPKDHVLLRVFVGGALQPEMAELQSDQLLSRVKSDLRDLLGTKGDPLFHEVSRWEKSMPQYQLGHLAKVQRIRERADSIPGLVLAGNAYSGPGIPDCIGNAEEAVDTLLAGESSLRLERSHRDVE